MPAFIPDDCLLRVREEMQLDDHGENLSWMDFKSYFVYLADTPLRALHDIVCAWYDEHCIDLSLGVFVKGSADVTLFANVSNHFVAIASNDQVMVVFFKSPEDKSAALSLVVAGVSIKPYTTQRFPPMPSRATEDPSVLAQVLASTWMFGSEVVSDVKKGIEVVDQKLKVSATLEESKISETVSSATSRAVDGFKTGMNSAKQGVGKLGVGDKVREADEKMKVSEGVANVKQKALENDVVRSGLGWMTGVFESAKEAVMTVRDETVGILNTSQPQQEQFAEPSEANSPQQLDAAETPQPQPLE